MLSSMQHWLLQQLEMAWGQHFAGAAADDDLGCVLGGMERNVKH